MESISKKIDAMGGTVNMADLSNSAEYMRVRRAVQRGELTKLRSGVYAAPEVLLDTMLDIERIVPGGVVCLYNAWSFYQLSTSVPPAFCVAIDQKRKVVIPPSLPVTLYYWKKENLSLGVTTAEISGHTVQITNLERSVCDAVKYRNKIGMDVCAEVVRNFLRKDGRNLTMLTEYAKQLRVWSILRTYLEIAME